MVNLTKKLSRAKKFLNVYDDLCQIPIYLSERVFYRKYKTSNIPSLRQKRLLIAGNGPSINAINLNDLEKMGIDILCVNFFALKYPDFTKIKPKYYCAIDPVFYNEINVDTDVINLYNIINMVDWDMYYICMASQNTTKITNKRIHIIKLSPIKYTGKYSRYSIYQKNNGNPGVMNVINAALYFAITGNADTIYLAGVDFSLHLTLRVDENNIVYDDTAHFYTDNKTDTRFLKQRIGGFSKDMDDYACALKEIKYLSDYASHKGIHVFNTTLDSFIDVFDKIPYEEINNYH